MNRTTNERAATQGQPCAARESTNRRNRNTPEVRGAIPARRFGPNLGECIIIALALGAAARLAGGGR